MSIDMTRYNNHTASKEDKRAFAVSAALTLIQAKVSNSPTNGSILESEINSLSSYADQIQEALKTK